MARLRSVAITWGAFPGQNFHRSARAPPATCRHAGHLIHRYGIQVTGSTQDFAVSLDGFRELRHTAPFPS